MIQQITTEISSLPSNLHRVENGYSDSIFEKLNHFSKATLRTMTQMETYMEQLIRSIHEQKQPMTWHADSNFDIDSISLQVIESLKKIQIYPAYISSFPIYVIDSAETADALLRTVLRHPGMQKTLRVIGMDTETGHLMDIPGTLQIAFSQNLVVVFQVS
jgi:hypothetical protein